MQELLLVAKNWDEAMVTNDVEAIGFYMSDQWTIVGSEGVTSKTDFLAMIASGVLTHSRMDTDEDIVKIFGNTGIIVSRGTSAGTFKGDAFHFYEWSTNVFIRENGSWKCVSTMLTPATTNI